MELKGAEIKNFYGISQILGNIDKSNYGLKIPHYQRPYKWDKENVSKLLEDWSIDKEETDYFSGSVVTVALENAPHELIDGQQRCTTMFLANFLLFNILKELTAISLSGNNYFDNYDSFYTSLIYSAKFLFNDKKFIDNLEKNKAIIKQKYKEDRFKENGKNEENNISAGELFEKIFLPIPSSNYLDLDENSEYISDNFYSYRQLFLSYDREFFNKSLRNSLGHCRFSLDSNTKMDFKFSKKISEMNETEGVYIEAILAIYQFLYKQAIIVNPQPYEIKSVEQARKLAELLEKFINEVKFCVVQTGNREDAYTLFEVLNDRALALDDLDLIKNLFYKKFVLENKNQENENPALIDKVLQQLDNLWVETIFKSGTSDSEKKLIAYLGITYITGDLNIKFASGQNYRKALKKYLDQVKSYSKEDIIKDFNIFYSCKLIVTKFNIRFKLKDLYAVESEYSSTASKIQKTIHLLNALDQMGVLSGLVSSILSYIKDEVKYFNPEKVNNILTELLIGNIEEVQKQAITIWKISMYSENAEFPRKFAQRIIENNNSNSEKFVIIELTAEEEKNLIKNFKEWWANWNFDKNSNLKVRLFFAMLIRKDLDKTNDLIERDIKLSLDIEKVKNMQLDHAEPRTPTEHIDGYFEDENREIFVNGFGNMMPLIDKENNIKNNMPLSLKSIKFYENMGLGNHFLVETMRESLSKYNDNLTSEFFNERKQLFVNWFIKCIESS